MDWQGKQLGNYKVERLLGSGAFADVYLGKHIYLNTSAAIKILQARLGENDLQSFLTEARTVASLTHPNIIRVLEFGVEEQTPYLVMDYAPAGTLRQRHPHPARLTVGECVTYLKQVASALQYAHDHHVIHRDVKPENMLIGPEGQLLLSDFGIAVAAQSSHYQGQQEFGGTAAYASPEQIREKASYASDQYALGIIFYEWLTGDLPFHGTFYEICSQHLFKPAPSLLEKLPGLSPIVEQVYQRSVAKEPQQRFARVEDFAQALETASRGDDPTVLLASGPAAGPGVPPSPSTPPASPALSPSPSIPSGDSTTLPAAKLGFSSSSPQYGSGKNQAPPPPPPFQPIIPPASRTPQQKKRNFPTIALIGILLVLLIVASLWGYSRQVAANNHVANQGQNQQPGQSIGGSNTGGNAPTPTPTFTPTPQPSVTVPDGVVQINKMLTCNNCDDPVHVEVDTVAVQNGNGRMIWDLTLTNVSGGDIELDSATISLRDSASAQDFSPDSTSDSNDDNSCAPFIDAGASADCTAIFAFLPYTQTTYTLTVEVQDVYGNFDVKFDPLDVTFS